MHTTSGRIGLESVQPIKVSQPWEEDGKDLISDSLLSQTPDFFGETAGAGLLFSDDLYQGAPCKTIVSIKGEKGASTELQNEDNLFKSEIEHLLMNPGAGVLDSTTSGSLASSYAAFDPKRNSLQSPLLDDATRKALLDKIQGRNKLSPESCFAARKLRCQQENCGKVFPNKKLLRKHQKTHRNKTFKCQHPGCSKAFYERAKLKRHYIVHTGEKQFVCKECNKCFGYKANLKTHMRTHTGEKPYVCPVPGCTRRFAQASNRNAHINTHKKQKKRNAKHLTTSNSAAKRQNTNKKKTTENKDIPQELTEWGVGLDDFPFEPPSSPSTASDNANEAQDRDVYNLFF